MYQTQNSAIDYSYMRHVGWDEKRNAGYNSTSFARLFSKDTVALISKKVSELTKGVDPYNRTIIIPDENIAQTLDGVFASSRRNTGDIYSRYIIPTEEQQDMVQHIIDQTIEVIVSNVRNTVEIPLQNQKLTAWTQVLGDFNLHGLKQYTTIKTLENRPATMQFNMNY